MSEADPPDLCAALLRAMQHGLDPLARLSRDGRQARGVVADAANRLRTSFMALGDDVQAQSQAAAELIDLFCGSGRGCQSIEALAGATHSVLDLCVAQAERVDAEARALGERVGEIDKKVSEALRSVSDMRNLAQRTQSLVAHVSAPAAPSSEDGGHDPATGVTEADRIAGETQSVGERMADAIESIAESVDDVRGSFDRLLNRDPDASTSPREELQRVRAAAFEVDRELQRRVERLRTSSARIDHNVGIAVTALQFEDLATQLIERIDARVTQLAEHWQELISRGDRMRQDHPPRELAEFWRWAEQQFAHLSSFAAAEVHAERMEAGDVELF